MSDQWVPTGHEDPANIAETVTARKLPTQWGGTGVSASSAADLKTQLGIVDATGATDVADGTAGFVPEPPTGSQRQALRGDMTHSDRLEIAVVTRADDEDVLEIQALGDLGCRLYLAAADATGKKARLGAKGADVNDIDLALEPKNLGRVTRFGDPIPQTLKPTRRLQAIPYGTTFDVTGLPTPTISTPGAAATTYQDADGSFVRLYQDASASRAPAMIDFGYCSQRRWDPEVTVSLFGLLPSSRMWIGLFTASPSGFNNLDDGDVKTPISAQTTISASSGLGFYDSANGFVTSGLRAGDVLTVSGFATGALNTTFDVKSVTAGRVETSPELTATEAAGASVTFTNTKHIHTSTSVVSVTSSAGAGYFTRSSGDFVADGWAVGDFVAASGFANAGNNVVAYVSAVTTTQLTTTTTLVTESSPGTPVTLRRVFKGVGFRLTHIVDGGVWHFITSDGATQTETDTGIAPAGTSQNMLRFRHIGSGSWDCAVLDSNGSWTWSAPQTGGPATSEALKLIVLCEPLQNATDRHMTVKLIDLFQD